MSPRAWICLIVIWLTSLVSVGVFAQTMQRNHDRVYSGSSIGFRVERLEGGVPTGTLVVRVNGKWTPVRFGVHPQPGNTGAR